MNLLTILRPALLDNRKDPRMIEKILAMIPYMPKIDAQVVA